jgi:hypothetical protein
MLPSPATLSRRLRHPELRSLLRELEHRLRDANPACVCKWIDGMPLPVGGSSGDRHARCGYGAGKIVKGYKLHAICDGSRHWLYWCVLPLNHSEKLVARHLIRHWPEEGYLVGDGEYDCNPLYDLAGDQGMQLVSPQRGGAALGHRRHSEYRLRCRSLLDKPIGQALIHHRFGIDRLFGHLGNYGGGLAPLPHWVRGLSRVRLWVQAKIILDGIRHLQKQRLTA